MYGEDDLSMREVAHRKISAFYAKYFPEKLDQVDRLLTKYHGREEDVIRTFRLKYQKWDWDTVPPPVNYGGQHGNQRTPRVSVSANTLQRTHGDGYRGSGGAHPPPAANDHNVNITLTLQTNPNGVAPLVSVAPAQSIEGYPHSANPYSQPGPYDTHPPVSAYGAPSQANTLPDGGAPPPVGYDMGGAAGQQPGHRDGGGYHGGQQPSSGPVGQQYPPPSSVAGGVAGGAVQPQGGGRGAVAVPGDAVSRSEIEHAFAALESKLTEAQRQDAMVLEAKLDQLLSQMRARQQGDPRGGDPQGGAPLQRQLREIIGKIDTLTGAGSTATQPAASSASRPGLSPTRGQVGQESDLEALVQKVQMLETQLSEGRSNPPPTAMALSQSYAPVEPEYDTQRHDTARSEALAAQQQMTEQQRYMRDMQQLQRKIAELERTQMSQTQSHLPLKSVVQQQHHHQQPVSHASVPSSTIAAKQPAGYHAQQQQQQHPAATGPSQSNDLRVLQDEIDELRRRDDLSRKLIHEKQMLLDTMFALSHHQQAGGSPMRGYPAGSAGTPGQNGGQVSPTHYRTTLAAPTSQVHHHYHPTPVWTADGNNPGI